MLQHECDDVWLRDRLAKSNRQRLITVRARPGGDWHELVARHFPHGLEHTLVGDSPALDLLRDHPAALFFEVLRRNSRAVRPDRKQRDHARKLARIQVSTSGIYVSHPKPGKRCLKAASFRRSHHPSHVELRRSRQVRRSEHNPLVLIGAIFENHGPTLPFQP